MELTINENDKKLLNKLGIDVFSNNRNYWFIRTQKGTYYEDFVNENFVGIEWDEISDINFIKESSEEKLKLEVIKNYPKIEKPGYIVNQILKFTNDMKKGDIVLIPNEGSKWISIGEFLEDEMYIYEEDEEDFQYILDSLEEDNKEKKQVLKKRRKVKWIMQVKRTDLDPYLYSIIYSHNAIVDANKYSIFIDRTLSQFYIKGDEAYFTYKVNKKQNIPYNEIISFLNNNNELIEYINQHVEEEFKVKDLILKINVQSRGPVQLKGRISVILILGMIITALFGGEFKVKLKYLDLQMTTKGLPKLLDTVSNIIEKKNEGKLLEIKDSLYRNGDNLQISVPNGEIDKSKKCVVDEKSID